MAMAVKVMGLAGQPSSPALCYCYLFDVAKLLYC